MYSCRSHNTVPDPLSAGLMIQSVCDLRSLIVFLSADERLCRVFLGVILYRSVRRLRMMFASESLSAETRLVHDEVNGLLIFWYASKSLLPLFIDNFLKGRKFKVRLDNTHSSLNPQEEGVPRGSILSPTLFTVKINSIIDALPDDIEKSLYVDDLAVYCQSSNMAIIERRLQGCLDKLVTCADENGFKFSPTKTLCVHFCKKNGLQPEPDLKLYGQQLPVEEQVKK